MEPVGEGEGGEGGEVTFTTEVEACGGTDVVSR